MVYTDDSIHDFIEKEKAEIASEYNLTEIRFELVCKQIYQSAKENNLIIQKANVKTLAFNCKILSKYKFKGE